jgi:small-conductance mechanosensitive channel
MIASTMATIVVLILMFLTGKFLSKSASMVLPPALEKLDEKADLGLAGGTTIIIGLTKVFIWGSAVLLILAHLEVDITAALASLTIFSLVIGMAMQESASNFIISAQLMIDKPYEVGDKIQVDLLIGTVVDIGFLSTKIKTSSEHLVIVPNKTMATTVVTNYAKGGPTEAPRRVNLKIDVEVGYDESPPHVKTVIRNIIEENELVLSDPEPVILFTQMMPSGLIFRVNCWVGDYGDEWVARDQVQTAILRRFKEEDIEIPYPHMQLKYDTADDEEEARVKKADEKKAQEDKEKRQEEARRKDAKHQAKRAEERAVLRKHADELRVQLENEELEDEERAKIGTELIQIETRISGTDDD